MIAGDEAMVCRVHPDAKKPPSHPVGLQLTDLPIHGLSHRSDISQCVKHMTQHSKCISIGIYPKDPCWEEADLKSS